MLGYCRLLFQKLSLMHHSRHVTLASLLGPLLLAFAPPRVLSCGGVISYKFHCVPSCGGLDKLQCYVYYYVQLHVFTLCYVYYYTPHLTRSPRAKAT